MCAVDSKTGDWRIERFQKHHFCAIGVNTLLKTRIFFMAFRQSRRGKFNFLPQSGLSLVKLLKKRPRDKCGKE